MSVVDHIRRLPVLGKGGEATVYGPLSGAAIDALFGSKSRPESDGYVVRLYHKTPDIENVRKVQTVRRLVAAADDTIKKLFREHFILPSFVKMEKNKPLCEILRYGGRPLESVRYVGEPLKNFLVGLINFVVAVLKCGFFLIDKGFYLSDVKIQNMVMDEDGRVALVDVVFNRIEDIPRSATWVPESWPSQMERLTGRKAEEPLATDRDVLSRLVEPKRLWRVIRGRHHSDNREDTLRFYLLYSLVFVLARFMPAARGWSRFREDTTTLVVEIMSVRTMLDWERIILAIDSLRHSIPSWTHCLRVQEGIEQDIRKIWTQTEPSPFRRFIFGDDATGRALLIAYMKNTTNPTIQDFQAFLARNGATEKPSGQRRRRITDRMAEGASSGTGSSR
jgi:hypothetical protein